MKTMDEKKMKMNLCRWMDEINGCKSFVEYG
jgi:hypothetical protein